MFWELIATLFAGLGAGGAALLIRRITGGRLAGWTVPAAAGVAMLAYAMWSEYSWADRTVAGLPEGMTVVNRIETSTSWKPWTYLAPQTTRFVAADTGGMMTNAAVPDHRLVKLYLFARWQPVHAVPQRIDCAAPARADIAGDATLDETPPAGAWVALAPDDPLVAALCVKER